jgi:hypothetical protein
MADDGAHSDDERLWGHVTWTARRPAAIHALPPPSQRSAHWGGSQARGTAPGPARALTGRRQSDGPAPPARSAPAAPAAQAASNALSAFGAARESACALVLTACRGRTVDDLEQAFLVFAERRVPERIRRRHHQRFPRRDKPSAHVADDAGSERGADDRSPWPVETDSPSGAGARTAGAGAGAGARRWLGERAPAKRRKEVLLRRPANDKDSRDPYALGRRGADHD